MEFLEQKTIQEQLAPTLALFKQYGFNTSNIEGLAPLINHFEIRIPFVGAFSAGKSTLINALTDSKYISTEITPETAVVSEVRYADELEFIGHKNAIETLPVTEAEVVENRLQKLLPDGWLGINLPSDFLKTIPHLVLVDMPGWSSNEHAHESVIDKYVKRSLAYVIVVSVEEGTVSESIVRALEELKLNDMSVILALSKSNKRPAEDAAAVVKNLEQKITQLMGKSPLATVKTDAKKKDTQELKDALQLLESRAQIEFVNNVALPWRHELVRFCNNLQVAATQSFTNAEQVQAQIDKFTQDMKNFDVRLQAETQRLEQEVAPVITVIRTRVESALLAQVDSLFSLASVGGDVSGNVLSTIRMTITEVIKTDFEPSITRYLNRLSDALPDSLDFDIKINTSSVSASADLNESEGFGWKNLSLVLGPILTKLPLPFARVAAVILPVLGFLFGGNSGTSSEEAYAQEVRREERGKAQIRGALANIIQQVMQNLEQSLQERVIQAKEAVKQQIAIEQQDIERSLNLAIQTLQAGEAEAAAKRAQANADLATIESWLKQLPKERIDG